VFLTDLLQDFQGSISIVSGIFQLKLNQQLIEQVFLPLPSITQSSIPPALFPGLSNIMHFIKQRAATTDSHL